MVFSCMINVLKHGSKDSKNLILERNGNGKKETVMKCYETGRKLWQEAAKKDESVREEGRSGEKGKEKGEVK